MSLLLSGVEAETLFSVESCLFCSSSNLGHSCLQISGIPLHSIIVLNCWLLNVVPNPRPGYEGGISEGCVKPQLLTVTRKEITAGAVQGPWGGSILCSRSLEIISVQSKKNQNRLWFVYLNAASRRPRASYKLPWRVARVEERYSRVDSYAHMTSWHMLKGGGVHACCIPCQVLPIWPETFRLLMKPPINPITPKNR